MTAGEKSGAQSTAASPPPVVRRVPASKEVERRRVKPYRLASRCIKCGGELVEGSLWEILKWEWSQAAGKNIRKVALLCEPCGIRARNHYSGKSE